MNVLTFLTLDLLMYSTVYVIVIEAFCSSVYSFA